MKKIIGLIAVVLLAFMWLNDSTPNEAIGELKESVEDSWSGLKKEIK